MKAVTVQLTWRSGQCFFSGKTRKFATREEACLGRAFKHVFCDSPRSWRFAGKVAFRERLYAPMLRSQINASMEMMNVWCAGVKSARFPDCIKHTQWFKNPPPWNRTQLNNIQRSLVTRSYKVLTCSAPQASASVHRTWHERISLQRASVCGSLHKLGCVGMFGSQSTGTKDGIAP